MRIYMLCFVDRGVLLGGGESVILWNKFFCCLADSQLLVVCMHVCEHTTSHHFNVKIALNISGLGAIDAVQLKLSADDTLSQRTSLFTDKILELLKFCLDTTYFVYKNHIGSPVSPCILAAMPSNIL